MAIARYSNEQIYQLETLLPNAISKIRDIYSLLNRCEAPEANIVPQEGESPQNYWHRGIEEVARYGGLPSLVRRVSDHLRGRTDVDKLMRLLADMRRPTMSDVLAEATKSIWTNLDVLSEQEDPEAAGDIVVELRRSVRNIQRELDDENLWPTVTPGMSRGEAQRVRELLVDRCLEALAACDVLLSVRRRLARGTGGSLADDLDRFRLEYARIAASADAKVRVIRSLRELHHEVRSLLA